MAQRTRVTYYSDLSGTEVGADATVRVGLDGATYEIDLTHAEQRALRNALAPYIAAGRPRGREPVSKATVERSGPTSQVLRVWAQANGFDVPKRGRIPAAVMDAYRARS
jgi:hypothetical protein